MQEINDRNQMDEVGTEIQAFHLEEPNVIWVYGLFDDQAALDLHRARNNADPKFHRLHELFTVFERTHETKPLFAKGISTGA